MRNGKGIMRHRAATLVDIASKETLKRIAKENLGGHKTPPPAIPVPRASRPQPTSPAGTATVRSRRTDGGTGPGRGRVN
jgi:hypothetical protein